MSETDDSIVAFVNGVDWRFERCTPVDGNRFYASEEDCAKAHEVCIASDGIAKVEIRFVRWERQPRDEQ